MRAFISLKYHTDHSNRSLITHISSALEANGFETICVVRDIEHWGTIHYSFDALMKHTFKAIDSCTIVIVELSEKGVGIGIEAGYAYAQGKPIVTIAQSGSDISSTLQGISTHVFTYSEPSELIELFSRI